jgi:hypothetical protein
MLRSPGDAEAGPRRNPREHEMSWMQWVKRPTAAAGPVRRPVVVATAVMAGLIVGGMPATTAAAADECGIRMARALRVQDAAAPGTGGRFQNFARPFASEFPGAAGWWAFSGDLDGPVDVDDILYAGDRLVLREGWDLPGFDASVTAIASFDGGRAMNRAGELAAIVVVERGDGSTGECVTLDGQPRFWTGDPVPDGAGDRFTGFSFLSVLDDGRIGFLASTDGPLSGNSVIVLEDRVLLRKGGPLPWDPSLTWDGAFDEVVWNGRGDLLFEGNTSGPVDRDRIMVLRQEGRSGPTYRILAREDDAYMSEKGPVRLELVQQASLSEQGHWALRVTLREEPATLDEAVIDAGGLVLREGDPVPTIPGASVGRVTAVAVDGAGRVASIVDLGGSPPPAVTQAVMIGPCAVTATGMGATGLPSDAWLAWFGFEDLSARDDGTLLLTAGYGGSVAGDGLFVLDPGPGCPADLDADGGVDGIDVLLLLAAWGTCPGFRCTGDLDLDGVVGVADLVRLLASWGACPA